MSRNRFDEMVPATARDRLGFLNPKGETGRIKLFPPELERVFRCTVCGMDIAVGPCFEHIDPATYVGSVCGCLTPDVLDDAEEAVEGTGRPGTATEVQPNG